MSRGTCWQQTQPGAGLPGGAYVLCQLGHSASLYCPQFPHLTGTECPVLLRIPFPFLCSEPPGPVWGSGLLPGRRLLALRVMVLEAGPESHYVGSGRTSVEWKLIPCGCWSLVHLQRSQQQSAEAQGGEGVRNTYVNGHTWAAGEWVVMTGAAPSHPSGSLWEITSQQR